MDRIVDLEKLLAEDPGDADLHYMMAQEHATRGDHQAAISWYDRCLEIEPAYCYAYFHKARSLEAEDEEDAARTVLEKGLEVARRVGDARAIAEIGEYLDSLRR